MATAKGSEIFVSFGDSEQKFSAEIENISAYSIKLWMKMRSTPGMRARIEISPGFEQSGTVLYCKREDVGCTTVIDFDRNTARPLRAEARTAYDEPATVTELGFSKRQGMSARTIDISDSGVSLRMDEELAVGTLVKIELKDALLFAEVRNCRSSVVSKCRIGLSVEWRIMRSENAEVTLPRATPGVKRSMGLALFRVRAFLKTMRRKR